MLFAIALAGAAGTLARYGVSTLLQRAGSTLPYGTLAVNVLGSFLLGVLLRAGAAPPDAPPSALRLALTVGFCGGFTTFSAFSVETALLLQSGAYARAALYASTSVLLSLAAVFAGFAMGR
jgi:CrcB protein